MKAIIPAAGHGTRFLPVTRVVPKEMLPIGAKPALELIVDEAKSAGADEIVLVISRGKELIRAYFEGDPSIRFVYQEEQRGLGHAVMTGLEALEPPAAGGDRQASLVLVLLGAMRPRRWWRSPPRTAARASSASSACRPRRCRATAS